MHLIIDADDELTRCFIMSRLWYSSSSVSVGDIKKLEYVCAGAELAYFLQQQHQERLVIVLRRKCN